MKRVLVEVRNGQWTDREFWFNVGPKESDLLRQASACRRRRLAAQKGWRTRKKMAAVREAKARETSSP